MNKSHIFIHKLTASSAIMLSLFIGGCVSVFPKPGKPPSIVPMRSANDVARSNNQAPFTIAVRLPNLPQTQSGAYVVIAQNDGTLAIVDEVAFSTAAPIGIQNVILETFDKAVAFRAAIRGNSGARADFELALDISKFEVTAPVRRHDGKAIIEGTARLINVVDRRPLATRVFKVETDAPRGEASTPAIALESATQTLALELLNWTQSTGRAFYNPHN